jgi:hypothetical protein
MAVAEALQTVAVLPTVLLMTHLVSQPSVLTVCFSTASIGALELELLFLLLVQLTDPRRVTYLGVNQSHSIMTNG